MKFIENIWRTEPTLVLTALAAVVIFVFARLGVVVPEQTVLAALAYVVPVVIAGVGVRSQVTPVKKP